MSIGFQKEPNQTPLNELDTKLAFLKYSYDLLNQTTQTSETLKLKHVTYFLATATIETNEQLKKLHAQNNSQETADVTRTLG
jgi:hypothetical protein